MTTVAPFVRTLELGDRGPDAFAVKRALKAAGYDDPTLAVKPASPDADLFGGAAVANTKTFQHIHGLTIDGVYGSATHAALARYFDEYGISLLEQEKTALEPRNVFLLIADLTVAHSFLFSYTEAIGEAPGDRDWWRLAPVDRTGLNWATVAGQHGKFTCDCSAHFIGCGEHAGIPSSIAHGVMDSDGATGALLADLDEITLAEAKPGDGVVYTGPAYPGGMHITILREKLQSGDWKVVNHGGPNGTGPIYSTLSAQNEWHAANGAPTLNVRRLPVP